MRIPTNVDPGQGYVLVDHLDRGAVTTGAEEVIKRPCWRGRERPGAAVRSIGPGHVA